MVAKSQTRLKRLSTHALISHSYLLGDLEGQRGLYPVEAVVTLRSGRDMCLQGGAGAPNTPRLTAKEAELRS